MRRFAELRLLGLLAAILVAAALLGRAMAPRGMSLDPRLSTRLTTPAGASAFRAALGRFGIDVTERRTAFFDLGRGAAPDSSVLVAVLAPAARLTVPERQALRDWVARGGRLLLAGETGVSACFGYVRAASDSAFRSPWVLEQAPSRTRADQVPAPRAVLRRLDPEDQAPTQRRCQPYAPSRADKLWVGGREPSALLLHFPSGGRVILVADATIFSNGALRNTDAGVMVLGWVLARNPRAVVVDEYHHGFGRSGSLPGAVLARTSRTPAGWMVLQLAAAGLVLLALGAVRFGPALPAIERRRRSPLEHLDALAAGLERSRASRTAIGLIVSGLRRRLGGPQGGRTANSAAWLATLAEGSRSAASRDAVERLRRITRGDPAGADVMLAANAVEDVWETLKVPTRTRS